tara:strand:- start:128 stop:502 length:375 start_codon:yes stop_codon:yes gene_type:complete
VDCQFVILVVVVPKRKKGVLNVPVVTRAKQALVLVVLVNNVQLVNSVPPAMNKLLSAVVVPKDITNVKRAKHHVCPVFLVRFKTKRGKIHVKPVPKIPKVQSRNRPVALSAVKVKSPMLAVLNV